jgi:hypothetical protein
LVPALTALAARGSAERLEAFMRQVLRLPSQPALLFVPGLSNWK